MLSSARRRSENFLGPVASTEMISPFHRLPRIANASTSAASHAAGSGATSLTRRVYCDDAVFTSENRVLAFYEYSYSTSVLEAPVTTTLFRLDASIRTVGSHSRALGDIVEAEWSAHHSDGRIVRREVGIDPVPATAWADAVAGGATPPDDRSPAQRQAIALAAALTDEIADADALLFTVPLYNFGVSQHFKTWVDLIITDPRMASGKPSAVAGKPAVLAAVHGGNYRPGTPRADWDHASDWIRRILVDVWGLELREVTREFTLVGVNPALDGFTDMAADLRAEAEQEAKAHGRSLAKAHATQAA